MELLAVVVPDAQQGIADDESAESLSSQFADAHGFQLAQGGEGLSPLLGVVPEANLEDRTGLDGEAGRARLALGGRPRIDPAVSQSRSVPMVVFAAVLLGRRHAVVGVLLGRRRVLLARVFG